MDLFGAGTAGAELFGGNLFGATTPAPAPNNQVAKPAAAVADLFGPTPAGAPAAGDWFGPGVGAPAAGGGLFGAVSVAPTPAPAGVTQAAYNVKETKVSAIEVIALIGWAAREPIAEPRRGQWRKLACAFFVCASHSMGAYMPFRGLSFLTSLG
jgi:hypothetical protein